MPMRRTASQPTTSPNRPAQTVPMASASHTLPITLLTSR
jgi:hypothetical protein